MWIPQFITDNTQTSPWDRKELLAQCAGARGKRWRGRSTRKPPFRSHQGKADIMWESALQWGQSIRIVLQCPLKVCILFAGKKIQAREILTSVRDRGTSCSPRRDTLKGQTSPTPYSGQEYTILKQSRENRQTQDEKPRRRGGSVFFKKYINIVKHEKRLWKYFRLKD